MACNDSHGKCTIHPEVPFMSTLLRRGSTGAEVRALQHALNARPYIHLVEDGVFGPLTETAVRNFQRRVHLGEDGIVGPSNRGTSLDSSRLCERDTTAAGGQHGAGCDGADHGARRPDRARRPRRSLPAVLESCSRWEWGARWPSLRGWYARSPRLERRRPRSGPAWSPMRWFIARPVRDPMWNSL